MSRAAAKRAPLADSASPREKEETKVPWEDPAEIPDEEAREAMYQRDVSAPIAPPSRGRVAERILQSPNRPTSRRNRPMLSTSHRRRKSLPISHR